MSRFTQQLYAHSDCRQQGIIVGEPGNMLHRSWFEVDREARRIAGALAGHGIEPGTRVAILAAEPRDIAPAVRAVWMCGASVTMLHQPTARTDLALWLNQTATVLGMIAAEVVILGVPFDDQLPPRSLPVRALRLSELVEGPDFAPVEPAEEDAAFLQLTSGSTGTPKAIVITHRNLYANITAMAQRLGLQQGRDVMVSWLPLFHDLGMIGLLAMPMQLGLDAVLVTPADFLRSPLVWAELIDRYRGTITGAPDFAYTLLARRLSRAADDAYDLSSMRVALNGAEPIDCAAMASFVAEAARFGWPGTALVGAYGMAEATLAISCSELTRGLTADVVDPSALEVDHRAHRSARSGRSYAVLGTPLPGIEVQVTDCAGVPLAARQVGELQVRGESVTAAFVTREGTFAARTPQGWLQTGDMGYRTESDELVICGRRKDIIIISGRNLYPADIERATGRVDGVRAGNAVAVSLAAGTPAETFAVLAESALHSDTEQVRRIRRAIEVAIRDEFGVAPETVAVLPPGALPKTPSGKLRRTHARLLLGP
ncbi:fatty acyl-AMP ligase [Nocardia sp. NPDC002869]|uniref:fatty acyl-AMP ligase n=1 Tax=Nocardia sp. NPDC002869 TaxID=3161032 RepID=UPI00398D1CBA